MRDRLRSTECAEYLKAVADPERLRIIQCLQGGPRSVGEICAALEVAIANASHHLRLLKSAGLVTRQKKGRFVIYALDPKFVRQATRSKLNVLDFGCCRLELGEQ
ncbi:MAG TPA: metalloregulator ArsR/SmtB family transcription factor [Tepidisphaeraceae bacterium]|jgi:ArsR family transcriptional regulator|nr:metalloregulator ArsR/SmtB family transcription factor [Tepidisphaeraceae bacterium]